MSAAIRIVLVGTTHPGNVGASARAMKSMGLSSLTLVAPQAPPDADATARAGSAADVLERAQVCRTVADAIAGCGLVVGATARARNAAWRVLDARTAAVELASAARERPAAVLFGNERNGLSNEELACCSALLRIPTAPGSGPLNLAQAVQVVCYEILLAEGTAACAPPAHAPAPAEEFRAFADHLGRVARGSGFLHARNAAQLLPRIERLFARAAPDDGELRILRGLLAAIERGLGAAGPRP